MTTFTYSIMNVKASVTFKNDVTEYLFRNAKSLEKVMKIIFKRTRGHPSNVILDISWEMLP